MFRKCGGLFYADKERSCVVKVCSSFLGIFSLLLACVSILHNFYIFTGSLH